MAEVGLIGGTGDEGRGIALRLGSAGHAITIGSRSESRAAQVADELNTRLGDSSISGRENRIAARSEYVFLTLPFEHAVIFLHEHGSSFGPEQTIVDVTVPLVFDSGPRLLDLGGISGAEHLHAGLPEGIPMAATLKTLPAHLLLDLDAELRCDELVCGTSREVRRRVIDLLGSVPGVRWLDGGPLRYCRSLEAITMLIIGLNRRYRSRAGRVRIEGIDTG